ncbi:hypothetical protein P3T35_001191 [Kitasatospora sp. GP30]|uniref:hypothetical protein n=1 Tax=Kitasatospora sp. GP30 TaxID=3035084 RepID=UPI000C70439C|nr:hypothetical protein [Kitasatospora sp. GP30]MDH6139191.1 hypothetical protein [Kitasatospora sp. GP30]
MLRTRLVLPLLTALLALTACGHQRADGNPSRALPATTSPTTSPSPTPSPTPQQLCPGESPSPTPSAIPTSAWPVDPSGSPTPPPTDGPGDAAPNYADNHRFQDQLPLQGAERCQGLAEAAKVRAALEPLRTQPDITPASVQARLSALGYAPATVQLSTMGQDDVYFTIDHAPICLDGQLNPRSDSVDAYAGYADGTGCQRPKGGH